MYERYLNKAFAEYNARSDTIYLLHHTPPVSVLHELCHAATERVAKFKYDVSTNQGYAALEVIAQDAALQLAVILGVPIEWFDSEYLSATWYVSDTDVDHVTIDKVVDYILARL